VRVQIGSLRIGTLPIGQWRLLTAAEKQSLGRASRSPARTPGKSAEG